MYTFCIYKGVKNQTRNICDFFFASWIIQGIDKVLNICGFLSYFVVVHFIIVPVALICSLILLWAEHAFNILILEHF